MCATSQEVWHWPEFRALAERLGIDMDRPTLRLVITFEMDETLCIRQDYCGVDTKEEGGVSDER